MEMKLLMLIVEEDKKEQLEVFLNRSGVVGYTEVSRALGVGSTGPRLGSRAFPKTSAIIFTIIAADAIAPLVEDLKSYCGECGERMKMLVWGVDEVAM
jgi:hypothetical protein